jgi:hypothetical protein
MVRSMSPETIMNVPMARARSRIRLCSQSRQSPYGLRRIDQTTPRGIGHLNEDRDVLVDLILGSTDEVPSTTPGVGQNVRRQPERSYVRAH